MSSPDKPPSSKAIEKEADFVPLESSERSTADSIVTGSEGQARSGSTTPQHPPLPVEEPPPLPDEPVPVRELDDGWEPVWDANAQAFYFYNRVTQATQWENPRVPQKTLDNGIVDDGPPGAQGRQDTKPAVGGYNPAIHGDYDPNADYAQDNISHENGEIDNALAAGTDPSQAYAATGAFNRFTGKWQRADLNPENFNDDNKSRRQMGAYFDVDAAANSHDGRSLKAERSNKKLSKKELKAFKEKRRERKEEKRRAWLRD